MGKDDEFRQIDPRQVALSEGGAMASSESKILDERRMLQIIKRTNRVVMILKVRKFKKKISWILEFVTLNFKSIKNFNFYDLNVVSLFLLFFRYTVHEIILSSQLVFQKTDQQLFQKIGTDSLSFMFSALGGSGPHFGNYDPIRFHGL